MKTKVSATPANRRARLERLVGGLAKYCPIDRTNPVNCPLFGLRPLAPSKKRRWIHGLTLDELEYLANYHRSCTAVSSRKG